MNDSHVQVPVTSMILLLPLTFLIIKNLSWHSGTSVLLNTLSFAFGDIIDTCIVVIILLSGFGAFGHGIFGMYGGSYDFVNFGSSPLRLPFPLQHQCYYYINESQSTRYSLSMPFRLPCPLHHQYYYHLN